MKLVKYGSSGSVCRVALHVNTDRRASFPPSSSGPPPFLLSLIAPRQAWLVRWDQVVWSLGAPGVGIYVSEIGGSCKGRY
jgi:hypothetical protein